MDDKYKVLLVEDEPTISLIIKDTFKDEGFSIEHATDGNKGLHYFINWKPDVIIADIMMPEMDGFEMVKRIRKSNGTIPILFLTSRSSIEDLVEGFELGANDYLKKPFKMRELIIRVKALLNRPMVQKKENEIYQIGEYTFNATTQELIYGGVSTGLSHLETEILKRLCVNINNTVEINDILNELWANDSYYNRNSLHVFIHKLKKALVNDKDVKIMNLRGVGYKLIVR